MTAIAAQQARGHGGESMMWLYYHRRGEGQLIGAYSREDPRGRGELERLSMSGLGLPLDGACLNWIDDSDEPKCPECGGTMHTCRDEDDCWHCDDEECRWTCGLLIDEKGLPYG